MICCDGTWQKSDSRYVSNVEKIARAVAPVGHAGEMQIVYYERGVGSTGSRVERLLAGAFGIGLDDNILDCYRYLALNYCPGDRITVFGFSRGAYTARSLVGMIAYVGLLRPDGVARDRLPIAMRVYRGRPPRGTEPAAQHLAEHAGLRKYCHGPDEVPIDMLGVFDTVGALGIPGIARSKYRFHDVDLTSRVRRARQALALAERRRLFAPCLWGGWHRDIRQVWFDGVHLDVGGGYENCFYSDKSLLWMAGEAAQRGRLTESVQPGRPVQAGDYDDYRGLKFDWSRLDSGLCRVGAVEHDSLKFGYRVANAVGLVRGLWARMRPGIEPLFIKGWRTLAPTVDTPTSPDGRAYDVRIEADAAARGINPNEKRWLDEVSAIVGAPPTPGTVDRDGILHNLFVSAPTFESLRSAHGDRAGGQS